MAAVDASAAGARRSRARNPLRSPVVGAFLRAPSGILSLTILGVVGATAIIAPRVLSDEANEINIPEAYLPPSREHLLGTDELGRDVMARTLVATELSLKFALGAAAVALVVGAALGIAAAVVTPRVRPVFQRFIDTMIAFPGLIVVIFISTILGTGAKAAMAGVGVAASFAFARFVSTYALSIGGRDYVHAARLVGVRRTSVMARHVLPNLAEPLVIALSFILTFGLLANAGLSFLGLGVQPPEYDWGRLLTDGVRAIYLSPALALGPAVALAITALAFGFFARGVRAGDEPAAVEPGAVAHAGSDHRGRGPRRRAARDRGIGRAAPRGPRPRRQLPRERRAGRGREGDLVLAAGGWRARRRRRVRLGEDDDGARDRAARALPWPHRARSGSTAATSGRVASRVPTGYLGTDVAFVFQDPMSSLNPALSIGRQLPRPSRSTAGCTAVPRRTLAAEKLREVNIPAPAAPAGALPTRALGRHAAARMIAMGLMGKPSLLICDEPTTALDVTVQAQIMELLDGINRTHETAVILISHNLGLVARTATGRRHVRGPDRRGSDAEQLLDDALHPYTRALSARFRTSSARGTRRSTYIPGETPDPASLPPGCPYHPRCPLAVERCTIERPPLVRPEDGRRVACWVATERRMVLELKDLRVRYGYGRRR